MPTIDQIRAARALLDWSQSDLADRADLSQTGIARIENGTNKPNSGTMDKILTAFDAADIEFIGESGVRKRTGEVRILKGANAMSDFLDDVFETAINHGSSQKPVEVFLSNVVHENWIKWMGEERWRKHTERMISAKDKMDVKILVKTGDRNFPASAYAEYRWMPEELFNDKSFYSYHDRLAFLDFRESDIRITLIRQSDFAKGYRDLFRVAWEHIAKVPAT